MSAWLVALAGGLLGVLVALVEGRRQGRKSEAAKRNADALRRTKAGIDAASKAAASGKTPEQIARDNDGVL